MLVNDTVQSQLLQLLAKSSVQVTAEGTDHRSAAAQLQLNPGQQVKAEILSSLSNHLYLARVAGELFKLEIPLVVQPGQSVPLTVVNVRPRLVFELRRPEGGSESVQISFLGKRLGAVEGTSHPLDPLPEGLPEEPFPEGMPDFDPFPDNSLLLPSDEEEQRAAVKLQLTPGQQLKGEVVQTLAPNRYLVKVEGESFRLELPQQLKPGETVNLSFVTAQPKVLFELHAADGAPEPVRVSSLGKWLAGAAASPPQAAAAEEPLVDHPLRDATILAARLKEVLTGSGLFYEAHLARWAAGAFPLAELLKEPQGKLSRGSTGKRDATTDGGGGNGIGDDRTLPLVKEQLSLLHGSVLTWSGEAWPGQDLVLTVRERDADEEEPGVETTLALELPTLGRVGARVQLSPLGLVVELVTDSAASCAVLKEGGEDFLVAGAAKGLHLSRVSVRHEETGE